MTSRRVVLLFNPASGRGKAERFARALAGALALDGWETELVDITKVRADPRLDGAHAVVIIGGDGSVHRSAPGIARAGVPMLIAPMGTENLLARELGMRADIDAIRTTLRDGVLARLDMPTVNGTPFLVMCSVGLDAAIVAQADDRRRKHHAGTISKSTYLLPLLGQALHPTLPELRITVDGRTVCDGRRGMLVIANCRRYAARLNPAPDASMTDGLLDVAFYPMRSTLGACRWALLSWLGRHERTGGFIGARGRMIEVASLNGEDPPIQIDGEPAPVEAPSPLRFIADAGRIDALHQRTDCGIG